MKLLILTQKVDSKDTVLGFFHGWLSQLANSCDELSVICLEKGEHHLPANVHVFSLGKDRGVSRFSYLLSFYRLIWQKRMDYDAVFVHMNQEYVLLGGLLWQTLGKRVFLWRNHPKGNLFTKLAVLLSDRVFCTSPFSFTAKFKRTKIMPVGIDLDVFKPDANIKKTDRSILFLGRISPIKKVDQFITALSQLKSGGETFIARIVGDALPKDKNYGESLKKTVQDLGLSKEVSFLPGVPNQQTPDLYRAHEIYINLTPSGSFDKTILEAMACGTITLMQNRSLDGQIDKRLIIESEDDIAAQIKTILNLPAEEKARLSHGLEAVAAKHGLKQLAKDLAEEMNSWPPRPAWQIVRYVLAGFLVVAVNLLALYLLTDKLKIWYLLSSVLAFFTAFVVSFFVQKFWTFGDNRLGGQGGMRVQLFRYFLLALVNLVMNTVLMYCFVSLASLPYLWSQVLTLAIITPPVFLINQALIFNHHSVKN